MRNRICECGSDGFYPRQWFPSTQSLAPDDLWTISSDFSKFGRRPWRSDLIHRMSLDSVRRFTGGSTSAESTMIEAATTVITSLMSNAKALKKGVRGAHVSVDNNQVCLIHKTSCDWPRKLRLKGMRKRRPRSSGRRDKPVNMSGAWSTIEAAKNSPNVPRVRVLLSPACR